MATRYFEVRNGGKPATIVRFDDELMATARWRRGPQEWKDDHEMDLDVVTGRDGEAFEIDEAEAERLRREVLTPR